jgi:hypothetical protein
MAKMYPFAQPSPTKSEAEKMLYWQFKKQLSDDYTVIHSLPWLKSAIRSLAEKEYVKNTPTGEVDFLILHPKLGILAIEVKGGAYKYSDHSFVSIIRDEKVDVIGQIRRNTHGLARWIGNGYGMPALQTWEVSGGRFSDVQSPAQLVCITFRTHLCGTLLSCRRCQYMVHEKGGESKGRGFITRLSFEKRAASLFEMTDTISV